MFNFKKRKSENYCLLGLHHKDDIVLTCRGKLLDPTIKIIEVRCKKCNTIFIQKEIEICPIMLGGSPHLETWQQAAEQAIKNEQIQCAEFKRKWCIANDTLNAYDQLNNKQKRIAEKLLRISSIAVLHCNSPFHREIDEIQALVKELLQNFEVYHGTN